MARVWRILGAAALIAVAVACTPARGTVLPAAFELYETPKHGCEPLRCRVTFQIDIESDRTTDALMYRCDVRALDEHGAVVASGKTEAKWSEEGDDPFNDLGALPYHGKVSAEALRTVTSIDGTCVVTGPVND